MRRLPKDFTISKYGLFARLVDENDAPFIIKLRTNPKLNKYLHKTSPNVDMQIEWIKEYKIREEEGTDYYFIFYKEGIPQGLCRLYDINTIDFSTGSWIFSTEAKIGTAFLAQIMVREIAFLNWGFEYENNKGGVHVDNLNVYKYDLLVGMKETGRYITEQGEFISLGLSKEDFLKGRERILRLLGVKE